MQLDAIRAGVIPVVLPVEAPMAWVAPRDIAEVAVLRLLSRGLGRSAAPAVRGMSTGLRRDNFVPELPRTVGSTTPTSLQAWCYYVLRPLT